MSFWPFPKRLRDRLIRAASSGICVELGAGGGAFRARLLELGIASVALDRSWSSLRELDPPCVRADATRLPLLAGSAGLLTAANLWRHLRATARHRLMEEAQLALAPGGALLLLEDSPAARNPAEANYRECLSLLAAVDPGRGAACTLTATGSESRLCLSDQGVFENETDLEDPQTPLRWLRARPLPEDLLARLDRLEREVLAHGMQLGLAHYQMWSGGGA
jgi:SAM-dependent methyltransferase